MSLELLMLLLRSSNVQGLQTGPTTPSCTDNTLKWFVVLFKLSRVTGGWRSLGNIDVLYQTAYLSKALLPVASFLFCWWWFFVFLFVLTGFCCFPSWLQTPEWKFSISLSSGLQRDSPPYIQTHQHTDTTPYRQTTIQIHHIQTHHHTDKHTTTQIILE